MTGARERDGAAGAGGRAAPAGERAGPAGVLLRQAGRADYMPIVTLINRVVDMPIGYVLRLADFARGMESPTEPAIAWVAEAAGRVVGAATGNYWPEERTAYLAWLAVDAPWQGRGLGRRLVDHFAAHARGVGARRIMVYVFEFADRRAREMSFYERLRFRPAGGQQELALHLGGVSLPPMGEDVVAAGPGDVPELLRLGQAISADLGEWFRPETFLARLRRLSPESPDVILVKRRPGGAIAGYAHLLPETATVRIAIFARGRGGDAGLREELMVAALRHAREAGKSVAVCQLSFADPAWLRWLGQVGFDLRWKTYRLERDLV